MSDLRIPFFEAVNEPRLLRNWFYGTPNSLNGLSFAQQTVLLTLYGCELDNREEDEAGFTRLDYYWASQGFGLYDEDGYLRRIVVPSNEIYIPHEHNEAWIVAGIRGGKSDRLAATVVAYEAVCGGHEGHIRAGKLGYCLQVCQDLRFARESLHGIEATLKTMPFLMTPLTVPGIWSGKNGERIGNRTADVIRLWNGMAIRTMPPTVKAIRGYDAAVGVLDEVGVWPTEDEKANVDKEVLSQIKSRQAQFDPRHIKTIGISSPWTMGGLLYERAKLGTTGRYIKCASCQRHKPLPDCPNCARARAGFSNLLVCHFTTASLGNPMISREWLQEQRQQDAPKFRRECLAEFQSSAAAFLPTKKIELLVDTGIRERPPITPGEDPFYDPPIPTYVAALDPAFRRDSFGFGIGHMDEHGKVIIDVLREWVPDPGITLKPEDVLDEITPLMGAYMIVNAASDQNSFEALNTLAEARGWSLDSMDFTGQSKNNIFGNLYTLIVSDRLRLLDHDSSVFQLKALQRKLSSSGHTSIEPPPGVRDDMAAIIAIIGRRCMHLTPAAPPPLPKQQTIEEQCEAQIARRRNEIAYDDG